MEDIKPIIESLLFVAQEPLTVDRIKKVLMDAQTGEIRDAIAEISEEYEARRGGFYLHEVAGGYQIRTRPEHTQWIKKLIQPRPLRLSKAALETLVIIAYKQPVIRSDIEYLRGVDCGGVLRVLLERKLIRVLGRKEIPGRPLIYATTKRFLEVFDLKNLKELPTPKEIEDLAASAAQANEPTSLEVAEGAQISGETSGSPQAAEDTPPQAEPSPTRLGEAEIPRDTLRESDVEPTADQPQKSDENAQKSS